jgi:hypothetical protein
MGSSNNSDTKSSIQQENKMPFGIENQLDIIEDQKEIDAIWKVRVEIARAEHKHPIWPSDIAHQYLIVAEEHGEMAKALNDYLFKPPEFQSKYLEELRTETIHTAAMCIRFLKNLEG